MLPSDIEGRILERLDSIKADVKDIKTELRALNGNVRQNSQEIAVLKATTLRTDAIRIGILLGGVAAIVGTMLKLAGVW